MDNWVIRLRVGMVVLSAVIVGGILVMIFGVGWQQKYQLQIQFEEAPGVTVDTPILKNGVLIGRVSDVQLMDDGVRITADIFADRNIRRGEIPRVSSATLFGDAVLEFVPGPTTPVSVNNQNDYYVAGDVLTNGEAAPSPMEALESFAELKDDFASTLETLNNAGKSVETAGQQVGMLAQNVNEALDRNEGKGTELIAKIELAMEEFAKAMRSVNALLSDEQLQVSFREALVTVPEVLRDAKETLASARMTFNKLQEVGDTFQRVGVQFEEVGVRAEQNLANLEGLTRPLGERGPELVADLERTLANVDAAAVQLSSFSANLNRRDTTLGGLVNDRELYGKLDRAATNIEDVSRRLRPIVEDVRVFSDKIARDPRQLGVKGALDSRPTGAMLKPTAVGYGYDVNYSDNNNGGH